MCTKHHDGNIFQTKKSLKIYVIHKVNFKVKFKISKSLCFKLIVVSGVKPPPFYFTSLFLLKPPFNWKFLNPTFLHLFIYFWYILSGYFANLPLWRFLKILSNLQTIVDMTKEHPFSHPPIPRDLHLYTVQALSDEIHPSASLSVSHDGPGAKITEKMASGPYILKRTGSCFFRTWSQSQNSRGGGGNATLNSF